MRFPSREGWTRALAATFVALGVCACVCVPACARRDVSAEQPTTKISYETVVSQPAIDKIDLLFVIDDSSSMGDKQEILADALPDLVRGIVEPKCVDKITRAPTGTVADPTKPDKEQCPGGSEPAFTPVTDMHVGVISTSLGSYGIDTCVSKGKVLDDRAHLLARTKDGPDLPAAGDLHFLSFYPDVEANKDKRRHPDPAGPKLTSLAALGTSLRSLVEGVGQVGCGIEAQLESAYRFLAQPDPWSEASITADGKPILAGIDDELLRQRAAFLRPDSLVAVVMLTDEEDASVDPLSVSGAGWRFLQRGPMKRATAACATTPSATACTSCGFAGNDPSCASNNGAYTEKEDKLNVRFTSQTKRRFGVDPRFPLVRYVEGFTKPKVAQRSSEHLPSGAYNGHPDCTNPLFAARLPTSSKEELCKLPRGPRSKAGVYFAVIGGVPHQLLPKDPAAEIDWTPILGRDPEKLDTTGINPHMLASTSPRPNLPPPSAGVNADPIHGREWTTHDEDLQYACTFDLYKRDGDVAVPDEQPCTGDAEQRGLCDCDGTKDSPLCKPGAPDVQIKAKAYPTIRELMVARALGEQGIAASLCPVQLATPNKDDYGYRPAVNRIVDRLEGGRVGACVPRRLERVDGSGNVSCIVAAILPDAGPDSECAARFNLGSPSPSILAQMRARLVEEEGEAAARHPICAIPQVAVPSGTTCRHEDRAISFCYAENMPGSKCGQALVFTKPTEKLVGARFTMQCIQLSEDGVPKTADP